MFRPVQLGTLVTVLLLFAPLTRAGEASRELHADRGFKDARQAAATVHAAADIECQVSDWKIIKDCGVTASSQLAQRSVVTAPSGNGAACPVLLEARPCAPVDCVVTPWSEFDGCGADRYKFRTRSVVSPPLYGGRACPALLDKAKCSATDCLVSAYSDWVCDAASSTKTRTRTIVRDAKPYGEACPPLQEAKPCDPVNCQLNTVAEDTGAWSSCQGDTGYQTKVLGVKTEALYNGTACPLPSDPRRLVVQTCQPPRPLSRSSKRNITAVLDILAYSDVYELMQDSVNGLNVGGPSRVVPIAKTMKTKNPNSLVLFAGDTMAPSLWSMQFKGMQMVDAHNAIGVDFASLGNHEFDFGIDAFLNVSTATKFPWLNANCYEAATGKLLRGTMERAIKELSHPVYGKMKIGLFGVMYDMKDSTKGLTWTDPIEAAKTQVKALQAEKVDMIIALTHQSLADDNRLSKDVAGIHLIYGGHDHASMLQTNFGTPYLKADFDFRSIWKSHIEFFAKDPVVSNVTVFRMEHTAVPITQEMPTDKALDTVIDSYAKTIGTLFTNAIGTLCAPLDLTNMVVRTKDAPIGHVITNAILGFYGAGAGDAVVQNGGAIRTDTTYPAGTLTLGQVLSWTPFGNTITIVETKGEWLKKFIEREMVGSCGENVVVLNGMYVHTAGVKYTYKCSGKATGSITSLEWSNHPTRTGPVQDTDTFKLIMNDFLFLTEFTAIPGVTYTTLLKPVEGVRVDDALQSYVKSQPNANLCENDATVRSFVSF